MAEQWNPDPSRRLHPEGASGTAERMHREFLGDRGYEAAVERDEEMHRERIEVHRERINGARARTRAWEALAVLIYLAVFIAGWLVAAGIVWLAAVAWQAITV